MSEPQPIARDLSKVWLSLAAVGLLAGTARSPAAGLLMRAMDVLLTFPALLLAVAIVAVLGPGLINAQIAIGIVAIPIYARIMRASVLSVEHLSTIAGKLEAGVRGLQAFCQLGTYLVDNPSSDRHTHSHPGPRGGGARERCGAPGREPKKEYVRA